LIKTGVAVTTDAGFYQECIMNEDVVNMEIRKFLKKLGIEYK